MKTQRMIAIVFSLAAALPLALAGCSSNDSPWPVMTGGTGGEGTTQAPAPDGSASPTPRGGEQEPRGTSQAGIGAKAPEPNKDDHFVFASFREDDQFSLYLAISRNGLHWTPVNGGRAIMRTEGFRDPFVAQGPDGVFHMVWTTGQPRRIGYARSRDLLRWEDVRTLPVMLSEPMCKNCWAPELAWDDAGRRWLVHFSSGFSDKEAHEISDTERVQQIYAVWTADFRTLSQPFLLFDPGYSVIDSNIVQHGGKWHMFFKDDRNKPWHQFIRRAEASAPGGPYTVATRQLGSDSVEGPEAFRVGNGWVVLYDHFGRRVFGGMASDDFVTWRDISWLIKFPTGTRHGGPVRVPPALAERIAAYDAPTYEVKAFEAKTPMPATKP